MATIGEQLRRARLDNKLELADLADRTKIGARYLGAIETDDRKSLPPGGFFYKNWVRQYAQALSLDVAAISLEVDGVLAGDEKPVLPGELGDRRIPDEMRPPRLDIGRGSKRGEHRAWSSFGMLVMVVLVCSGCYAWLHDEQVSAAPQGSQPVEETKVEAALARVAPAPVIPSPKADARADVATAPEDGMKIEVAAIQQTWLSISPDGQQAFSAVLQPDEIRTVSAHNTASIRVGNAGGLSVRLNGKPIGPIGPPGQIRTVIFNRAGFHILEPKPAALAAPSQAVSGDRATVAALHQQ